MFDNVIYSLVVVIALIAIAAWLWFRHRASQAAAPKVSPDGAAEDVAGFWERLRAKLTAQPVLWLAVITLLVVVVLKPVKIGLLVWGICKLAAFAFAGDWCDARIFPKAQPDDLVGIEQGTAWKRKGLIVAASIVAGALLA